MDRETKQAQGASPRVQNKMGKNLVKEDTMHEHKTIMTMDGEFCPTCGQFVKDIKVKKQADKPEKVKKGKKK